MLTDEKVALTGYLEGQGYTVVAPGGDYKRGATTVALSVEAAESQPYTAGAKRVIATFLLELRLHQEQRSRGDIGAAGETLLAHMVERYSPPPALVTMEIVPEDSEWLCSVRANYTYTVDI